jgi:hypothetical protein
VICCDTCPFVPTCEEVEDFERDVLHLCEDDDDWFHQSTTACCPRQTIPDSCECLEGCDCSCVDCDCPRDDDDDE